MLIGQDAAFVRVTSSLFGSCQVTAMRILMNLNVNPEQTCHYRQPQNAQLRRRGRVKGQ